MRIYLPMRINADICIIRHMSDIARYMRRIFRIGILSASAWPSLICIWRLNSPHTCTSLALFPFVSLSPVYDPDEKFWNYFKLAGTLTLTITFPAANAALWMPIKGTTDPWVDAIAGVTLLITNLANRWRHFQLALLIVMYQARRICNFFHARGKVSPILLV